MPSLHSSRTLRIAAFASILAGLALWHFAPVRRKSLMPRIERVLAISDRFNGGSSRVHLAVSPKDLRFQYALRPGVRYPWAGINLRLADSSQTPVDLNDWASLEVHVLSSTHSPLRIQLLSDDLPPGSDRRDSVHLIYHALEYTPSKEPCAHPWLAFQIPSWWREQNRREDQQRVDLLDRLRSIEFQSGYTATGTDSANFDLLALDLLGPNRFLQALGLALALLGAASLALLRKRSPCSAAPGANPPAYLRRLPAASSGIIS